MVSARNAVGSVRLSIECHMDVGSGVAGMAIGRHDLCLSGCSVKLHTVQRPYLHEQQKFCFYNQYVTKHFALKLRHAGIVSANINPNYFIYFI